MSETAIAVSGFYYAYPHSELMLQDINLTIEKGSVTAIAGPSGAGKTTLCRAMTGIVPYYYGGRYAGRRYQGEKDFRYCHAGRHHARRL